MKIKVLGVCGSPIKKGNTEQLLARALEVAREEGAETELVSLAKKQISDCIHCNWCLAKQKEGHYCSIKDDMTEFYEPILNADVILFATPVYLGRLSGQLADFIDRLRCIEFGNFYEDRVRDKVGGALAVAWARNCGMETALLSIVTTLLMLDMIPVGTHMVPLGAAGVSSIHGTGEFDVEDKLLVLKDESGLKSAEILTRRAIELARIVKIGKESLESAP